MGASIVIPTTMRRDTVPPVVEAALAAVAGMPDGEVILVPNGPSEGRRTLDSRSPRLRVIECPLPRMSAARNAGLARARNDIVLLTDDDCLISPEWAERLTRRLREGEVSIATSLRMRRDGPVTSFLDYQRIFNPRPVDGMTVDYPLASCMGIRQDLVGFWFDDDLDSGDELQFGARLRDAGITTVYDTEAPPPLHLVPERLESVTERFYRYGVSNARVLIRKDRPEFSIPSATALYSSLCGNRVTTPRRFEEVADPQPRQAFATLELALLGSFLAGYLDEAGRALGREIIRLDRRTWDAGWHEIERRLEDDFAWDGDWGRLPVDFDRWLAPQEPRAPALAPEVAAILRQGAPLTREAVAEPEIDRGGLGARRADKLRISVDEIWGEMREGRLPVREEAIEWRLREAGITFRDGLQAMETIALGPVQLPPASP
jgi:hypothetical protein